MLDDSVLTHVSGAPFACISWLCLKHLRKPSAGATAGAARHDGPLNSRLVRWCVRRAAHGRARRRRGGWEAEQGPQARAACTFSALHHGQALLKALVTRAQGYAWEITTAEGGWGLDGVLQSRGHVLDGIANGIDTTEWSPALDTHLAATYTADDMSGASSLLCDNRSLSRVSFSRSSDAAHSAPMFFLQKTPLNAPVHSNRQAPVQGRRCSGVANPKP